jgi:UDP-N-acetylmuramoyl-tripeptide--D-alanyl-D-alanine ligase
MGKTEQILAFFTHKIIAKYNPTVIGITGSVGKTSTRHAIAAALASSYYLREPEKNYNNLIGIPLTVIGAKGIDESTNFVSIWLGWARIYLKALSVWLLPQNYPKLLVLEYGIDAPGDMDALLNLVAPNIAVLTSVGISHLQNFSSQQELAAEKGKIASRLTPNDLFVFNGDDTLVSQEAQKVNARKIAFGVQGQGTELETVILEKITEKLELRPETTLQISTLHGQVSISIPVIGKAHTAAVLCAVAVCVGLKVDQELFEKGLRTYKAMPGRLNILAGIKKTILIDDTYNAAPDSTKEALHLLGRFQSENKIAVLGDMLELGEQSHTGHSEIGTLAATLNLKKLVTVGKLGREIADSALQAGMSEQDILIFEDSKTAAKSVLEILVPESVVLVKGSQGARMEIITKELLAEPTAAGHLLVRQYGKWL